MIETWISRSQLARLHSLLEEKQTAIRKQISIAINATADKVKSTIAKDIGREINLNQKSIKKLFTVPRRATPTSHAAVVRLKRTKNINLKFFGAKQVKAGIRVKVMKSEGTKLIPSAFIPPVKYRNNVYKRLGKARGPIVSQKGPSVAVVFEGRLQKVSKVMVFAELRKQIERRIRFIALKKSGAI